MRHNGKQHIHDNKMLEKEVKKMVGAAVGEAASNLTLNPRAVHQSIVAKMMEKHRNQSAPSLLPTYKAFQQKICKEKVPPEFKVTLDGLLFCIADHIIPGRSGHVLGFSSPSRIITFLSGDLVTEYLRS